MTGGEILCNVRGGKLDENLLSARLRSFMKALRLVKAVRGLSVVDIRQEESWYDS
jgi:hypothetical protein